MAKFSLTAQLGLQAPSNTKQVVSQIQNALKGVSVNVNINANTRQLSQVSNQLNSVNQSAKAANASVSELGKTIGAAARRFGAISLVTGTFLGLSRSIKNSLGDAIEFERQMVVLSQVTGKSVKQLNDLYSEVTRLATGFGVSSDSLLKTSIILAQAGLEARKTKGALEVLAKTQLAASFDDITSTTEGAIAILAQFKREAASAGGDIAFLEKSLEAINQVSKKYAVESSDLVAVIRRSGGAFEAAGGSLNELLALFTSVRATTRESAETISTGLRTIFTRIQRVDTIKQLKDLGIELQDLQGRFVGPYEAIKRISEGLSSIDPRDFRFAQIVEELGGFRQISKVIPLIKQFGLAQEALNTAQSASGSLTQDAATAQQSLANQLTKVSEEFQALIRKFSDSEAFKSVAGGALEFARALIRIADAIEPLLPMIGALAAVNLGKGFASALGAFTGFGGMGRQRRNGGGKIYGFATGGMVPGSGNGDTVPAMLSPGEFVIRKASVKKFGAENLARLNKGGIAEAPLVDDLPNTKDAMKPRPGISAGSPLSEILRTGHGALDFDATLQRTTGDKAYARAKNDAQRQEVLSKYFRDSRARLNDAKSAKLTQFGQELQGLIQAGQIDPKKLTLISKSSRTPGLPEHVKSLFGIPIENMIFTSGGSKQPALDAFRQKGPRIDRIQRKALGGLIQKFAKGGKAKLVGDMAKQTSVGALILQPNKSIQKPSELIDVNYSDVASYNNSFQDTQFDKKYILRKSGIKDDPSGSYYEILNNGLNDGIKSAVNAATENIAQTLKIKRVAVKQESSEFSKYINKSARGVIFEEVIAQLSRKGGGEPFDNREDTQAPFDFIGSIGKTTDLFANEAAAAAKYKDAKSSDSNKLISNFKGKIARQIAQENYSSVAQQISPNLADELKKQGPISKAQVIKFLNSKNISIADKAQPKTIENKLQSLGIKDFQIEKTGSGPTTKYFYKFAKGGIAPSDTVPALLTPGEFVINKKTAQRVGYGKLHRLNKTGDVQGYAKGGVVGGVQRFAQGGKPDLGTVGQFNNFDSSAWDKVETYLRKMGMSAEQVSQIFQKVYADAKLGIKPSEALRMAVKDQVEVIKKSTQEQQKQNSERKKVNLDAVKNLAQSAQSFVFLSGLVTGLATQFSGLSDATAKAATETIAFGTTMLGIAGTVVDLGVSLAKVFTSTAEVTASGALTAAKHAETAATVENVAATRAQTAAMVANKGGEGGKAAGGLLGILSAIGPVALIVIAALAALGGAFYFMKAKSKALADELSDSAKKLRDDIESGKKSASERQKYIDKEVEAAKNLVDSYWFIGEAKNKEISAAKEAARALIDVVISASKLDKQLQEIDANKGLSDTEKTNQKLKALSDNAEISATELLKASKAQAAIAANKGARVEKLQKSDFATEGEFKNFEKLSLIVEKSSDELNKFNNQVRSLLQNSLEQALSKTDFSKATDPNDVYKEVIAQNKAFAESLKLNTDLIMAHAKTMAQAQRAVGNYIGAFETEKGAKDQIAAMEESNKLQSIAAAKAAASAAAFAKAMEGSQKLSYVISRLGDLFADIGSKLDQFGSRLDYINSVINNQFANFEIPPIKGLEDISKVINIGQFKNDINNIAKTLGQDGQDMADQIVAVAGVFKASDAILNKNFGLLSSSDAETDGKAGSQAAAAIDDLLKPLRDKKFAALGSLVDRAKQDLLDAASGGSESGAFITAAEREKALGPIKEFTSQYSDLLKEINDKESAALDKYQKYSDALFATYQKEIDFREKAIDIQQKGAERFAEATGRSLTTTDKEAFRTTKIDTRLQSVGIFNSAKDAKGLGATLRDVNKQLFDAKKDLEARGGRATPADIEKNKKLTLKAQEATSALEKLADQSDLAADVLNDIGKERAKRQAATKVIEDFVTGGLEERANLTNTFAGIEMAAQSGTLQNFAPEMRKSITGMLDQLAAGDEQSQFAQLKKNLIFNDAVSMGLDPQTAQLLANATPVEQKLQQDLINITKQEQEALAELAKNTQQNKDVLEANTTELRKLNDTIAKESQDRIKTAKTEFDAKQKQKEKEAKVFAAKDAVAGAESTFSDKKSKAESAFDKEQQISKALLENTSAIEKMEADIGYISDNGDTSHSRDIIVNRLFGAQTLQNKLLEDYKKAISDREQAVKERDSAKDNIKVKKEEYDKAVKETGFNPDQAAAVNKNTNALSELKTSVDALKGVLSENKGTPQTAARGGVIYRAGGGSTLMKPKGSDTVPAMLTPGEFVVNAQSAGKYRSVLNKINNSRGGPIYLKDGGLPKGANSGRVILKAAGNPEKDFWDAVNTNNKKNVIDNLNQEKEKRIANSQFQSAIMQHEENDQQKIAAEYAEKQEQKRQTTLRNIRENISGPIIPEQQLMADSTLKKRAVDSALSRQLAGKDSRTDKNILRDASIAYAQKKGYYTNKSGGDFETGLGMSTAKSVMRSDHILGEYSDFQQKQREKISPEIQGMGTTYSKPLSDRYNAERQEQYQKLQDRIQAMKEQSDSYTAEAKAKREAMDVSAAPITSPPVATPKAPPVTEKPKNFVNITSGRPRKETPLDIQRAQNKQQYNAQMSARREAFNKGRNLPAEERQKIIQQNAIRDRQQLMMEEGYPVSRQLQNYAQPHINPFNNPSPPFAPPVFNNGAQHGAPQAGMGAGAGAGVIAMDQSSQDILQNFPAAFGVFVDRIEKVGNHLNGLTVNHALNISGDLTINTTAVATELAKALGPSIEQKVLAILEAKENATRPA